MVLLNREYLLLQEKYARRTRRLQQTRRCCRIVSQNIRNRVQHRKRVIQRRLAREAVQAVCKEKTEHLNILESEYQKCLSDMGMGFEGADELRAHQLWTEQTRRKEREVAVRRGRIQMSYLRKQKRLDQSFVDRRSLLIGRKQKKLGDEVSKRLETSVNSSILNKSNKKSPTTVPTRRLSISPTKQVNRSMMKEEVMSRPRITKTTSEPYIRHRRPFQRLAEHSFSPSTYKSTFASPKPLKSCLKKNSQFKGGHVQRSPHFTLKSMPTKVSSDSKRPPMCSRCVEACQSDYPHVPADEDQITFSHQREMDSPTNSEFSHTCINSKRESSVGKPLKSTFSEPKCSLAADNSTTHMNDSLLDVSNVIRKADQVYNKRPSVFDELFADENSKTRQNETKVDKKFEMTSRCALGLNTSLNIMNSTSDESVESIMNLAKTSVAVQTVTKKDAVAYKQEHVEHNVSDVQKLIEKAQVQAKMLENERMPAHFPGTLVKVNVIESSVVDESSTSSSSLITCKNEEQEGNDLSCKSLPELLSKLKDAAAKVTADTNSRTPPPQKSEKCSSDKRHKLIRFYIERLMEMSRNEISALSSCSSTISSSSASSIVSHISFSFNSSTINCSSSQQSNKKYPKKKKAKEVNPPKFVASTPAVGLKTGRKQHRFMKSQHSGTCSTTNSSSISSLSVVTSRGQYQKSMSLTDIQKHVESERRQIETALRRKMIKKLKDYASTGNVTLKDDIEKISKSLSTTDLDHDNVQLCSAHDQSENSTDDVLQRIASKLLSVSEGSLSPSSNYSCVVSEEVNGNNASNVVMKSAFESPMRPQKDRLPSSGQRRTGLAYDDLETSSAASGSKLGNGSDEMNPTARSSGVRSIQERHERARTAISKLLFNKSSTSTGSSTSQAVAEIRKRLAEMTIETNQLSSNDDPA